MVVNITHIVDSSSGVSDKFFPVNNNSKTMINTVSAVGRAFDMTMDKKPFFIFFLFGSKASMSAGAPIVIKFISVKWIGLNG